MRLVFLVFIFFVSCSKAKKDSNTLSISLPGDISTLDPANCYDTVCYVPVAQIYESLFEYEYLKRPYSIKPLLANSMPAISSNKLTYTFKIKPNIKYHPSPFINPDRTVKAQDFINQIKRLAFIETESRGWWLFDGKIKGLNNWRNLVQTDLNKFFNLDVPGLKLIDDSTFSIELTRPYPQLIYAMALPFTAPIPEEVIKGLKNNLHEQTIGTGPYTLSEYNPTQVVTLKKNSAYISSVYPSNGDRFAEEHHLLKDAGAKLPFIENIKLVVIKEAQTDWLNFLGKKTDLLNLTKDHYQVALSPNGQLKTDLADKNINLQASPTLIYWWLAFNMKDPILGKNLNLRKAIAHAINIDRYIELFTYNVGQKANSIYPPGIPGYSPSAQLSFKYDVNLAKDFLKKAGYPEGKGAPRLTFDVRGTDTIKRQMGEYIQKELSRIGIQIDVNINSFPSFLEKSRQGKLQFWQGGWVMDYPDAENVLQLLSSANLPPGTNSSQYVNPEFDKLFNEIRELNDGPKKFEYMRQMERMVNEDLPWVMQFYTRNYVLYHDHLQNFRYSDIIYNSLKYLKIRP